MKNLDIWVNELRIDNVKAALKANGFSVTNEERCHFETDAGLDAAKQIVNPLVLSGEASYLDDIFSVPFAGSGEWQSEWEMRGSKNGQ